MSHYMMERKGGSVGLFDLSCNLVTIYFCTALDRPATGTLLV